MAGKHIPQRTCVGCREVEAKRQMVRVVRKADGHALVDTTGKQPGRGAYVHLKRSCWELALASGRLAHALRMPSIDEVDRVELQAFAAALPLNDDSES